MIYTASLIGRETIATNTIALHFEKPKGFTFRAGQYTVLSLASEESDGYVREFSIASAPYENVVTLAMRVRDSDFKRICATMPIGTGVELGGPVGDIHSREGDEPELWIAGGIGATPLISIMRDGIRRDQVPNSILLHSNRTKAGAPFADELSIVANARREFSYIPVFTREAERKRINAETLRAHVPDYAERMVTIIGTRPFVAAVRGVLAKLSVPESLIRFECFCGYTTHDQTYANIAHHTEQIPNTHRIG